MASDPGRLLSLYERGVITGTELVNQLVAAATEIPPAAFARELPVEILEQIRGYVHSPRGTKWRTFSISTVCNATPEQLEAARESEQRVWLAGLDQWRDYFEVAG